MVQGPQYGTVGMPELVGHDYSDAIGAVCLGKIHVYLVIDEARCT
jgi:hypothetical protein